MRRVVLKVNIPVGGLHQVPVPVGARLLFVSCQLKAQEVQAWYEAEWEADGGDWHETTVRNVQVFATGEEILDEGLRYAGTALGLDRRDELHVYEQTDPTRRAMLL